ncbi:FirrV-1-A36 [Feldmannia irregularis virus a]|uniref:FirrV-1-A36 n=1 Tax=Feldmannia irregularis virus a TaxID=231992 RepID=Q6XM51_9PHYC|nr:FirrV-1-A36 [Feldmannia irregularis virus a]AAR26860.1 FirrV-1-A36 [Feldmannia irregularis virus a]
MNTSATPDERLSAFEAEKIFDNGWTNASMDLLEDMCKQCRTNASAYARAARTARWKYRMLSIPSIVVASFATATSFFSAGSSCEAEESNAIKICVAILTSITAILHGVTHLYSFDSKMTACIAASGNFDALAKQAQMQIYLSNNLRGPVEVILTEISAEYCHLTNTSPLL